MKDFVTFELAKKLKEKGFSLNKEDIEFIGCRFIFSDECTIKRISTIGAYEKGYFGKNIDCPTISQVLNWLREEKKLHIELWTVGKKPIKWCHTITTLNHVGEKQGWSSGKRGDSYEAAAIAGIEYCLDNLI